MNTHPRLSFQNAWPWKNQLVRGSTNDGGNQPHVARSTNFESPARHMHCGR